MTLIKYIELIFTAFFTAFFAVSLLGTMIPILAHSFLYKMLYLPGTRNWMSGVGMYSKKCYKEKYLWMWKLLIVSNTVLAIFSTVLYFLNGDKVS